MPLPWLRLLDGFLGARDIVRAVRDRSAAESAATSLEMPLVGVVVGALREAFNRDAERIELERQRLEEERRRAERAMRLELLRQAGDREISRLRLLGGAALVSLFVALFLATRVPDAAIAARVLTGLGALMLLGSLAAAFAAHAQVSRLLTLAPMQAEPGDLVTSPAAKAAPWLFLGGLGVLAIGVLLA